MHRCRMSRSRLCARGATANPAPPRGCSAAASSPPCAVLLPVFLQNRRDPNFYHPPTGVGSLLDANVCIDSASQLQGTDTQNQEFDQTISLRGASISERWMRGPGTPAAAPRGRGRVVPGCLLLWSTARARRDGGTCPLPFCAVHPLWRRAASRTRVNRYLSSRRTTPDDLKSHRLQASCVS